MGIREEYDFDLLENTAVDLVLDELQRQLADNPSICTCQECVLDMAALALNNVKPYYRVSLLGKLYAETAHNTKYGKEVHDAVAGAIKKIAKNPSHEV